MSGKILAHLPLAELDTLIERVTGAIDTAPDGTDLSGWRSQRCWLLAARYTIHRPGPDDMVAALADFDRLPESTPGRSRLAAVLVIAQVSRGRMREHASTRAIVALAAIAEGDPHPLEGWPDVRAVVRAMSLAHAVNEGVSDVDATAALAEVEQLAARVGHAEPFRQMIEMARVLLLHLQSRVSHDFAAMDEVAAAWRGWAVDATLPPAARRRAGVSAEMAELIAAAGRGDLSGLPARLDHLSATVEELPAGDSWASETRDAIERSRAALNLFQAYGPALDDAMASPRFATNLPLMQTLLGQLSMIDFDHIDVAELERLAPAMGVDLRGFGALWGLTKHVANTGADPPLDLSGLDPSTVLDAPRQGLGGGSSAAENASRRTGLGVAQLALGMDDLDTLATSIGSLREAVAGSPANDPYGALHLSALGLALCRRFELTREAGSIDEAITVLAQAQRLAGSPDHPHWGMTTQALGHAYRLAGRLDLGRETGRRSLRGHAWSVLLQSSTEAATAAARQAAGDAVDVARWCLADQDPAGAAAALDAGRALMAYAATAVRDVPAQLESIGEEHLARRWREASATGTPPGNAVPGGVPVISGDLRRQVLHALAGAAAVAAEPAASEGATSEGASEPAASEGAAMARTPEARLLDPPTVDEIRSALRALRADALVYLVPGDAAMAGAAVVVGVDGPPTQKTLLGLRRRPGDALEEFILATSHDAVAPPADQLGRLCDWAWTSAIGPLLAERAPRRDRPHRLILVPMGELGRVPWHAARRPRHGGGHRYAMERAVFSYAVSARLLCDAAFARPDDARPAGDVRRTGDVRATGDVLIVADPDTAGRDADLSHARVEALGIRDAFYHHARYLGRTADGQPSSEGVGSPAELLDWLARAGPAALVHLACHGVVRAGTGTDDTAYLTLAAGERLAAEELMTAAASGAVRPLELAVLAACDSGVSGRGYDEAFSLASAFLAMGARTVVASQWSVPSRATSVLMFMFHHYLRHDPSGYLRHDPSGLAQANEGRHPADALREAQLWMVRAEREVPDTMPHYLRPNARGGGRAHPLAWAGFVHFGR